LIVLNNSFTGTNSYDLGFIFNRGTLQNQAFIWNEPNKEFRLLATTETGATFGAINQAAYANLAVGNLTVTSLASIASIALTGNITAVDLTISGNANINGGIVTTEEAFATLFNSNVLTAKAFGSATDLTISTQAGGTANIGTANIVFPSATTFYAQKSTIALFNSPTTVNAFTGAATALQIGNSNGTLTLNPATVVGAQSTQTLYNTVATTVNAFGAMTLGNIGAGTGTLVLNNPDINGSQPTQNLFNTGNTTQVNLGGSASVLIGSSSGNTQINNATLYLPNATNIAVGGSSFTFANTVSTTVNAFGKATELNFGTNTGITTVRNSLAANGVLYANANAYATGFSIGQRGALSVAGGATIAGNLYVGAGIQGTAIGNVTPAAGTFIAINGDSLSITGNITQSNTGVYGATFAGNVGLNGPYVTTSQATIDLLNTNATTVNAFGAATLINIGASSGTTFINNNLNSKGNVSASQVIAKTLSTRSDYGNIHLTQFASIFAQGNNSENQSIVQVSTTGLSDGMGMWGFTGLNGRLFSTKGINFVTGVTVRDQDTPTGGVGLVTITPAGDLWANATTPATNSTTGAFVVKGGVGIGGNLYVGAGIQGTDIGNTTAATGWFTTLSAVNSLWANASISTTTQGTGAIIVPNGGISVAGAANIGGTLTAGGATQLNSTLGVGGAVTLTLGTNATGTTSGGTFTVTGGAAFSQDVWIGGNLYVANIIGQQTTILSISDPLLYLNANNMSSYNYDIGLYSHFIGTGLGTPNPTKYQHTGVIRNDADQTWTFFSNVAADPTSGQVSFDGFTVYDPIKAGNLALVNGDRAIDFATGALRVAGGASITGNLYVGSGIQNTKIGNVTPETAQFTTIDATLVRAVTLGNTLAFLTGSTVAVGNISAVTIGNSGATVNADTVNSYITKGVTLGNTGAFLTGSTVAVGNISAVTIGNTGATVNADIVNSYIVNAVTLGNTLSFHTGSTAAFGNIAAVTIGNTGSTGQFNTVNAGAVNAPTLGNTGSAINGANLTITAQTGAPSTVTVSATSNVWVQNTAASSSTTTGAVIVYGGVGIKDNLNVGIAANTKILNASTINAGAVNAVTFGNTGASASFDTVATGALSAVTIGNTGATGQFNTVNAGQVSAVTIGNTGATGQFNTVNAGAVNAVSIGNTGSTGQFNTINAGTVNAGTIGNTGATVQGTNGTFGTVNAVQIGNVGTSGTFSRIDTGNIFVNVSGNIQVSNTATSVSPTTGALTVAGGVGINSTINTRDGATFNYAQSTRANAAVTIKGASDSALFVATPGANGYDGIVIGGQGNVSPQGGIPLKVGGTGAIMIPVGSSGQTPGATGNVDLIGMIRYDTGLQSLSYYNGDLWASIGGSFTVILDAQYTGDGAQVEWTLSSYGNAVVTTSASIVSINGVLQLPGSAYSVALVGPDSVLTFTEAPAVGDVIDVRYFKASATVQTIQNGYAQFDVNSPLYANITQGNAASLNTTAISVDQDNHVNLVNGAKLTYDQDVIRIPAINTAYVVDTFYQTAYSSAKYIVQAKNNNGGAGNVETQEALVITDGGGNAHITVYGTINMGWNMGNLRVDTTGGNVNLYYTGITTAGVNANVKVYSNYIR
jgi:hypothetical protein